MNKQSGFSILEFLLVIVVLTLVGSAGLFVWKNQSGNKTEDASNKTQVTQQEDTRFTECYSDNQDNSEAKWITIDHQTTRFSNWKVQLTIPENLVGKAVCRVATGGYELSTKAIIEDPKCVNYYKATELTSEGIQIWRYTKSTEAYGQIYNQDGTLEDYYNKHKATDGNYFTEPSSGRRYYRVGDNFYVAFGDTKESYTEERKNDRTNACANEKPDYALPFIDSMSTLKEY